MPRQIRIEFADAIYHVMARANHKDFLFSEKSSKILFLKTLEEAAEKAHFRILSYALMDNHYHLLIKTPEGNLVKGMTWLQSTFTARFNRLHKHAGHVFTGRYKAVLVEVDSGPYLSTLIDYINLNPARAKIWPEREANFLKAHRWTTLYWLEKKPEERPPYLDTSYIFNPLKKETQKTRTAYLTRLETKANTERTQSGKRQDVVNLNHSLERGWVYGSQEYAEAMKVLVSSKSKRAPKMKKMAGMDLALSLKERAGKLWKIKNNEWILRAKSDPQKIALALILREKTTLSLKEISELLHMGTSASLSTNLHKANKLTSNPDSSLNYQISQAKEQLLLYT